MRFHPLETSRNLAQEREVSTSLEIHNYTSFANRSKRDISCRTHKNHAEKPQVDRYLETIVFGAT